MPYIEAKCPRCGSNLCALDVAPVEVCVVCEVDYTDHECIVDSRVRPYERVELNYPDKRHEQYLPDVYDKER